MVGNLAKTENPIYEGHSPSQNYLPLGEQFTFPNGGIDCNVNFYISPEALEIWSSIRSGFVPRTGTGVFVPKFSIEKFYNENFHKFKNLLLQIFDELIQYYKGFPSRIHLTERVWLIFEASMYYQANIEWSSDFKLFRIRYNINSLKASDSHIANTIKHEFLHIISEIHHGQNRIISSIDRMQSKLNSKIEENKIIVEESLQYLLKNFESQTMSNGLAGINSTIQLEKLFEETVKRFYGYTQKMFWNFICDSALCVIAIELDDLQFINYAVQRDAQRFFGCERNLKWIKNLTEKAMKNENDDNRKNFLSNASKLFQFIICLDKMPYEGIAYSILGEDWRPGTKRRFIRKLRKYLHRNKARQNIDNFRSIVQEYCDPEAGQGFLRFYDSYLRIVNAQAIHNDPSNPDVTKQIFDTECLNLGKEAYKTLNREFYILFKKMEEYRQ